MANKVNIQDNFLNAARKDNVPITVHLVNGFQIKGNIRSFDQFTIIMDSMGKQQMIYKHAVSTITPAKAVKFLPEKPEGEEDAAEAETEE